MSEHNRRHLLAALGLALLPLMALLAPTSAYAAGDTTPPTTPANLRIDALSHTWVTLAWDPSTDNAGAPMYEAGVDGVSLSNVRTFSTSQGFGGLQAGVAYSASVWAVDLAGNRSATVSISFTTLPRTQPPPSAPTNLRPVYVDGALHTIAWDATPSGSPVSYQLFSGPDSVFATWGTSVTVFELVHHAYLDPGSTHTFTVQAIAEHNYLSEHSAPLSVTLPWVVVR
jgi:hypothetical protein